MIAYFDCFSGISGDMILGALFDLGFDVNDLKNELKKLNIDNYEIKVYKINKQGISATKVDIYYKNEVKSLKSILNMIEKSSLDDDIRRLLKQIFFRLGKVESKIHNISLEEVKFHEVADSIIDIVGSVLGIKKLNIAEIYSSPLPLGRGFTHIAHGKYPLPVPATLELLKGVPIYQVSVNKELVTPTGAAIITTLTKEFCYLPEMNVKKVGYGAATSDLEQPNVLRIILGEEVRKPHFIEIIETNIDDMNPEVYSYLVDELLKQGALDVYLTNIIMKKNRPAVKLTILSYPEISGKLINFVLKETTSFGVRIYKAYRHCIRREIKEVKTRFGKVKVKIGAFNNRIKIMPEYEECKRIALQYKIPLIKVYDIIRKEVEKCIFPMDS